MVPKEMPTKLLVVGSGAIGVEFASFYSDMGAEVTIVEMLRPHPAGRGRGGLRLRPQGADQAGDEDPRRRRASRSWRPAKTGVKATIKGGGGRRSSATPSSRSASSPNSEEIGLEALGVKTDRGHIVDRRLCPHQCRGHLRDRRRHRPALAGAQGEPRGRGLRRGDRRRQAARRSRPGTSRAAPIRGRRWRRSA